MKTDIPDTVLIITPFCSPNIGGAETRLDNILEYLDKKNIRTRVITYQPITTAGVKGKKDEQRGAHIRIRRIQWIGGDLFHKLLKLPLFDMLYLSPVLFLFSFFFLLRNRKKIGAIHAMGFNAALVSRALYPFFHVPFVVTIHTLYDFPPKSVSRAMARWILKGAWRVLALSPKSKNNITGVGLPDSLVGIHTNWINIAVFNTLDKDDCKKERGLTGKFVVAFVGRLKKIKGVDVVLACAKQLQKEDIHFLIAGYGPMEGAIARAARESDNIHFAGSFPNYDLPRVYNAADISMVPSLYEEGFARTIIESLGCGLPVIASDMGCIPEMVDSSCGILFRPTVENFSNAILKLSREPEKVSRMSAAARRYCEKNYSEANMKTIIEAYNLPEETNRSRI
jgi:glycosyltransferase involved in cell wall biosynthesis